MMGVRDRKKDRGKGGWRWTDGQMDRQIKGAKGRNMDREKVTKEQIDKWTDGLTHRGAKDRKMDRGTDGYTYKQTNRW
jgi:hypothetical protein